MAVVSDVSWSVLEEETEAREDGLMVVRVNMLWDGFPRSATVLLEDMDEQAAALDEVVAILNDIPYGEGPEKPEGDE